MRVLLVDVDSRIPNLALMQVSAARKSQGHEVGWNVTDPDEVWVSCIFTKNRPRALGITTLYPEAQVRLGGSGINYDWLPPEMQKVKPDYDLYPSTYSQGFTTRGCPRKCPFCIVPSKEGMVRKWQHPREFHDPRFDTILLLDNNLLALQPWFFEVTDYLLDNDLTLWDQQGYDVRLLTRKTAARLRELRLKGTLHFAFDNVGDERAVRRGIGILRDAGFDLHHEVQFYVLVGFNTTPEEDAYRCRLLKSLGTNAFVMPFRRTPWTTKIARWANRKWLYWGIDIADYARRPA